VEGTAHCYGAATIVNGIATGLGAAFGISLKTVAKVELTNDVGKFNVTIEGDKSENPAMAICCVRNVLKKFGLEAQYGANIITNSEIPISRGLKSSSAAANAIVLATYNTLEKDYNDMEIINLGIDSALEGKVSITGAFDDACATYFGNVVVTDNIKREILNQYSMKEDHEVIIHVPDQKIKKTDVDTEMLKDIKPKIKEAHDLAMNERYLEGLTLNGMTYGTAMGLNTDIAKKALTAGASAAGISGTGPATVILAIKDKMDEILEALGTKDRIIVTKINHKKALPV
jgi:shikimate kinase